MRDFDTWLSTFRDSINGYDYYVDFPKVYKNVEEIKLELNMMNYLIGSKDIKNDFLSIYNRYPEILKCIPILLAVRQNEIYAQDEEGAFLYNFKEENYSIEQYMKFMEKTGLLDLIANHIISNLVDYATGVETGLDSNGRKNRGGHQMENLVERFIKKTGAEYHKEMYLSDVEKTWNVDLSSISNQGKAEKRWDYVVKSPSTIFLIETNFYTGGGSKLNETARSYKMIAEETKNLKGIRFVWITDGKKGWTSARKNLQETFDVLDTLYNITDMENGVFDTLFKE